MMLKLVADGEIHLPATKTAAAQVVERLKDRDVDVVALPCDVSPEAALRATLQQYDHMPPIKGCINSAMDVFFETMEHAQWEMTVRSKVQTSWNLHWRLPQDLLFFMFLLSLLELYGSTTQANYASVSVFQDALARHCMAHGQKAVSLDLGWLRNFGIVAETEAYQQTRQNAADITEIDDNEVMAVLDMYRGPESPTSSAGETRSQLLVGFATPVRSPLLLLRPLFASISAPVGQEDDLGSASGTLTSTTIFQHAAGFEEKPEGIVLGLATGLARAMSVATDDIESSNQLFHYTVDSLMAIELRSWVSKDFRPNVTVFEIMGEATIADIGNLVVEKMRR
ncbi:KR domain-containing protein [Xylariaceae sp. FL0804]|nr:KR domain-containing protein [Xylariaceae sp. FL0804]